MRRILTKCLLAFSFTAVLQLVQSSAVAQCSQWNVSYSNQCTNNPAFQLTGGTPSPGIYIGNGVIGSGPYFFSPLSAGPGTHKLGYKANSCTDTAFVLVVVNTPPTVTLSALGPYCENRDSVALSGGSPTTGGVGYYFGTGVSGGSGKFGPTVGAGGSPYTISYTFKNSTTNCSDTASVQVNVTAVTPASISGLDTAYCLNQSPQIIPVTGMPTGGTLNGSGISGSNFNIGLAGSGFHTIRYYYTNTNNCTDTAKQLVHVRKLPTVNLVIPPAFKFVCAFDAPYGITGNTPSAGYPTGVFSGTGVDSILGTFDPDPTILGWNVIKYKYSDGKCKNTAIDSILVNPNPVLAIDSFPILCSNGSLLTLNQGIIDGIPAGNKGVYSGTGVTGSPGAFYFDPSVAGAGSHQITFCYTAANGCQTCVSQNITVVGLEPLNFPIKAVCENAFPEDMTTWVSPNDGVYFIGPGVDPLDSVTFKAQTLSGPGSYNITVYRIDKNGCKNSKSQSISLLPKPNITLTSTPLPTPNPPVNPSDITVKICHGDTANVVYSASPSGNFGWQYYQKIPPQTSFIDNTGDINFFPDSDWVYFTSTYINSTPRCYDTGYVHVMVIQDVEPVIDGKFSICIGDTTTLTASGGSTYEWLNPFVTTASIEVSPVVNTTYEVTTYSDIDGDGKQCSEKDTSVEVLVNPLPIITTGLDTTIFVGDQTVLRAYGGISYEWREIMLEGELSCYDCATPVATPIFSKQYLGNRIYFVTGTDLNGCESEDSIIVYLNPRIVIFVPTAFSPNGDGINDELIVKTKGVESFDFEIYDRNGRVVFTTVYSPTKEDVGWNGRYLNDGELMNKDVYLYKLSAKPFKTSVPIDQAGQITLVR